MEKKTRDLVMGKCYLKNKEFKLAEKCFTEVLNQNPENVEALKSLAEVYEHTRRFDKAFEMYVRSYSAEPERRGVLLEICRILLMNDACLGHVDYQKWLNLAMKEFPSNQIVIDCKSFLSTHNPDYTASPKRVSPNDSDYAATPKRVDPESDEALRKILDKLSSMEIKLAQLDSAKPRQTEDTSNKILDKLSSMERKIENLESIMAKQHENMLSKILDKASSIVVNSRDDKAITQTTDKLSSIEIKTEGKGNLTMTEPPKQSESSFFKPSNLTFGSTPFNFSKPSETALGSSPISFPKPTEAAPSSSPFGFAKPTENPLGGSPFSLSNPTGAALGGSPFSLSNPTGAALGATPFSFSKPAETSFGATPFAFSKPSETALGAKPFSFSNPLGHQNSTFSETTELGKPLGSLGLSSGFSFTKQQEEPNDENDDGPVPTEELPIENTCDMKVIEMKSGEEDEDIVYDHRCKLFRFRDGEYKERGLGTIKILKHKFTGKGRLIMRREVVHKICLNCWNCTKIDRVTPTQVRWSGMDASDGSLEPTVFLVKFKTSEITDEFITHLNTIFTDNEENGSEKKDDRPEVELVSPVLDPSLVAKARQHQLPDTFYHEMQKPCVGCVGCKDED